MKVTKSVARNDIYQHGLKTPADNKQGFTLDRSKPSAEKHSLHDGDDKVIVKKGETYYSWAFAFSPKQISLTYPKRQQLTRSSFLTAVYDIQDSLEAIGADTPEDLQSLRDGILEEIRELAEQTQESLDNMPDSLQSSPTGELLQERIDALESWADDLEGIELDDYDDPDEQIIVDNIAEGNETFEDLDPDEVQEFKDNHLQEWIDEKIDEIQNTSGDF